MLYAGEPKEGLVVGLGSKGEKSEKSTSFSHLGELRALCWALKETEKLVQGMKLMLETDSKRVYQCLPSSSLGSRYHLESCWMSG